MEAQTRKVKAVAFDLEGPLVDFEKHHFNAHCAAARKFGCIVDYDWIVQNIPHAIGGGDELIATGVARHFGIQKEIQNLLKQKRILFTEMVTSDKVVARPGVFAILEWLVQHKYQITIGSNTPNDEASRYIHDIGIDKHISRHHIVLVEHVGGKKKPLPDIYLETARRVSADPRQQLVIDDSPAGLEAASAAGSPSIATPLHRTHSAMMDVVRWGPRRIIHDWREIDFARILESLEYELVL